MAEGVNALPTTEVTFLIKPRYVQHNHTYVVFGRAAGEEEKIMAHIPLPDP